jgi:glucose/arabinose dehydrogenase
MHYNRLNLGHQWKTWVIGRTRHICQFLLVLLLASNGAAAETVLKHDTGRVRIQAVVEDLYAPWAVGFLPGGGLLITERDGVLIHVKDGVRKEVGGLPAVYNKGQGGLLDVAVARDFTRTRTIFLTFAEPRGSGAGTALASARLSNDASTIVDVRVLYRQKFSSKPARHFGSRVVEGHDGYLYVTVGDRGDRPKAQSMAHHNGKVIRVDRNGGGEIYSLGHRNPQGAALDEQGRLWTVEHGAKGGDEVNRPERGKNYGWPVISYGVHYKGGQIGEGTHKDGMEQPVFYWDPSIAPSGMMIYSGKLWPEWRGDIFVGSLKFDLISRLERKSDRIVDEERLFKRKFERIRDVREAPDGSIYFLAVGDGVLYRMVPN